jgi:glycosyltransferase involved in cell wall biosynthesis
MALRPDVTAPGYLRARFRELRSRRPGQPAVGIVSNEFFDLALGRMGGFGWAARTSAECLGTYGAAGYRPVLLVGRGGIADAKTARRSNGVPLIRYDDSTARYTRTLTRERVSLYLLIDYRPNYLPVLEARDGIPLVVWIRDPKTPDDYERIGTLRVPMSADPPVGVPMIDTRSLGSLVARLVESGIPVSLVSPAPTIAAAKAPAAYGTTAPVTLLPNPLTVTTGETERAARPRIVFLARLDPIKRPWLFVELARRFPGVDFCMLGQSHFTGPGSWQPSSIPENLQVLGHVDGPAKTRLLGSASMLVNTSIHEALPVSFLEALHCGTPIVACCDPELVVSRFGAYVGEWEGSGLDSLSAFSDAIERLLDERDLTQRLGHEGREWARQTHTREQFLAAFARLAGSMAEDGG